MEVKIDKIYDIMETLNIKIECIKEKNRKLILAQSKVAFTRENTQY